MSPVSPLPQTVDALLGFRAAHQPDQIAYRNEWGRA